MPQTSTDKTESHHDSDLLLDTFDKGNSSTFENKDGLRVDNSFDREMNSKDVEEKKETNEMSNVSFFKRLLSCTRRKKVIGAFLGISFIFHFLVINGIYRVSRTGEIVEPARCKITSRIKLIEDHKTPEKPQTAKPTPPVTKKPVRTIKPAKPKTVRAKKLSSEKLIALGKKHMSKVREGEFPLLTLSYASPSTYVKEMYELGAKTLIYDRTNREFFEINLFSGEILPFSSENFKTFSFFKRVIKDFQWNYHKNRVASRVNASPDSLEILLLVPMIVETRWVGHQADTFQRMGLQISQIQTVEGRFQRGRFKLVQVYLKDGSSRKVDDRIGV